MGLLYLETCPTDEALRDMIQNKLLSMSRFRSRLNVNKHGARFEEVDELDWGYHVGKAFEDEVISEEQLREFAGALYDRGLDLDKPLWRILF